MKKITDQQIYNLIKKILILLLISLICAIISTYVLSNYIYPNSLYLDHRYLVFNIFLFNISYLIISSFICSLIIFIYKKTIQFSLSGFRKGLLNLFLWFFLFFICIGINFVILIIPSDIFLQQMYSQSLGASFLIILIYTPSVYINKLEKYQKENKE